MLRLNREEKRTLAALLVIAVLLFALLQLWRPYYFLTDDNLSKLSVLVQMGERLSAGQSPYVHTGMFGGYFWLRDPAFMHFTHPVILPLSLLALTPLQAMLMDLLGLLHLLMAAVAFFFLARHIRLHFQPELAPGWIIFLSLSYTFCAYNVIVGTSWAMYMANLAALPLIVLGLLQRTLTWGTLWTALGVVNAALLGHMGPLLWGGILLSAFALLAARAMSTWRPVLIWGLGGLIAVVLTSPVWLLSLSGFLNSERTGTLFAEYTATGAYPFLQTFASVFFGAWSQGFGFPVARFFALDPSLASTFACFAAAWLILPALRPKLSIKAEALSLSRGAMLAAFLAALLVARPLWLAELLQPLPVVGSLRWPFKELFYVVFFLHLWLLLRPWRGGKRVHLALAAGGTLVLLASLFQAESRAPSFSDRSQIRNWYLSGAAHHYWKEMQPLLPPGKLIVPLVHPGANLDPWNSPTLLVASGNYGGLFPGVTSAYGYSPTPDATQLPQEKPPHLHKAMGIQGIFLTDLPDRWLQQRPDLVALELLQVAPVQIRMRHWEGEQSISRVYIVSSNGELTPLDEAEVEESGVVD